MQKSRRTKTTKTPNEKGKIVEGKPFYQAKNIENIYIKKNRQRLAWTNENNGSRQLFMNERSGNLQMSTLKLLYSFGSDYYQR